MDFYQGVVVDYLRADRAVFVNTECCIQINPAGNPDASGPHWYCDVVAVDFRQSAIFLCEISYSLTLDALCRRLNEWNAHWPGLCNAIVRDCHLPPKWPVRPWLFIPEQRRELLKTKLAKITCIERMNPHMPEPLITSLKMVATWMYKSWNRHIEGRRDSDNCDKVAPDKTLV